MSNFVNTRPLTATPPLHHHAHPSFRAPGTGSRPFGRGGRPTVSVCIPAHNEAETIHGLVSSIRRQLLKHHLIDEIVVIDDRSTDDTARLARAAGARVYASGDVLGLFGPSRGKGDAMWRSLAESHGDIVVWCDADLRTFNIRGLMALVEAVRDDAKVVMAKGYFRRLDDVGRPTAGGRVTELVVRPMLSLLWPDAARIREPLSGMMAIRRTAVEQMSFESDYGVDVGLLLDTISHYGADAVVDVDLGVLGHRHQAMESLAVQAGAVQRAILSRAGHRRDRLGTLLVRDVDSASISAPLRPPLASLRRAGGLPVLATVPIPAVV